MAKLQFLRKFEILFLLVNLSTINFELIQAQTINMNKRCPEGYFLHTDELCYPEERQPCPSTPTANVTPFEINKKCPEGYYFHTDELCHPIVRQPCPFEGSSTTSTPITTTTPIATSISTTTVRAPAEIRTLNCPEGSIMIANSCRKIICSLGEFYRGICLQAVCPPGLVWRGRRCQQPGYVTTLIEIDNVFVNEVNEKPIALATSQKNEVVYHTSTHKPIPTTQSSKQALLATETLKYTTTSTTEKNSHTNDSYTGICCKIYTPRICKLYGTKWLCFNRKYQRCDNRICKSPVVYLKAPEIKYVHPMLVMPPNPQLAACKTNNCENSANTTDCSGCTSFRSENCSLQCYSYVCPNDTCTFVDLKHYCSYFSGQSGCLETDGCLWKWCKI